MELSLDDVVRLLVSAGLGAVLGFEREYHGKPAGIRTMILVCMGATLFTLFSVRLGGVGSDQSRVAAQIVTGVGFLGAGAILHERRRVSGLTTAASIWLIASIGIGAGLGEFGIVVFALGLVLVALVVFAWIEEILDHRRHVENYNLLLQPLCDLDSVQKSARDHGLRVQSVQIGKSRDHIGMSMKVTGALAGHREFTRWLLATDAIVELRREAHLRVE